LEGFRLVQKNFETSSVCFWYIPANLRGKKEDEEWWQKINNVSYCWLWKNKYDESLQVAPAIKEKIVKSGKLMVGYSPLLHRGMYNFFRMITTCHPVPTYSDMDYVIAQIQHFGEAL
jgi:hypothetical protein